MKQYHNTLFITTQGAYLTKDHETLHVKVERQVRLTVPLHHLDGVVCFGRVSVSPAVFALCAEHDLAVSFLTEHGRFLARVCAPVHGNVLLRREQYRRAVLIDAKRGGVGLDGQRHDGSFARRLS